jgi:HlyD family secretion protein
MDMQRPEESANKTQKQVWTIDNGILTPVNITVGSSDGIMTEVVEGDIKPGTELVVDTLTPRR